MNLHKLNKNFNTEKKCLAYLEKTRFKNGIYCLHCKSDRVFKRNTDIRYHCNNCNRDFSVLYGTIFENTKLDLPTWFAIITLMVNSKSGISAKDIERNLGISYKTAWYCAMRVRCAMIETPDLLEGIVEMDEAFVGGKPRKKFMSDNTTSISTIDDKNTKSKRGRGTNKTPIIGIASRGKEGNVVTEVSQKLGHKQLLNVLKKNVNTNEAVLITDEFKGYNNFEKYINHIKVKHNTKIKGANHTNTIENFWKIIKSGIKGNYKAISPKYLPFYLTEYAHKYNQRNKTNDFDLVIESAMDTGKCLINFKPKKTVTDIVYNKEVKEKEAVKTKPLKKLHKTTKKTTTKVKSKPAKK